MQPKIIKSKNNNIFQNGRRPQLFFEKEDDLNFLEMDDDLKKIVQPKIIKSKNNDCGTTPGNLVLKQYSFY